MSIARRGLQGLPTDPGAVQLILPVRNVDEVVANAKKAGAEIVSKIERDGRPGGNHHGERQGSRRHRSR